MANFCVLWASEPPVTIVGNSTDQDYQDMMAGDELILACEVSRLNAPVRWFCNDRLLTSDSRTSIESYGTLRKIIVSNVQSSDSGKYVCDAVDDKMICVVRIQGESRPSHIAQVFYTAVLTSVDFFTFKSLRLPF